jgi:hypothetical protein
MQGTEFLFIFFSFAHLCVLEKHFVLREEIREDWRKLLNEEVSNL